MGMDELTSLVQERRPAPAVPARIGRHEVLVEESRFGTFVYRIVDDRVLVVHANSGFRDDVVTALLDAVDDLVSSEDLGAGVHMRPIDVAEFPLDRAAMLGPGQSDFFHGHPSLDHRGLQVIPMHRSEAAVGDEGRAFRFVVSSKGIGIEHPDWTRAPVARADLQRLDDGSDWFFRRGTKTTPVRAQYLWEAAMPSMPLHGRVLVREMRGHELELSCEWDQVVGTLRAPDQTAVTSVTVPRTFAWEAFGPLFRGEETDVVEVGNQPTESMLQIVVFDRARRADKDYVPAMLSGCLRWIRALVKEAGNFVVFRGRSGGIVQMMWKDPGPRLWLETPDPHRGSSLGRYVEFDEAERMITILAREDRVAMEDLGDLTEIPST